jgi:ribosome-binding protein aMBF1 (putative translation factor)
MVMDHAFHEYVDVPTAAQELGLSESHLWRLLRRLDIPRYRLPHHGRRIVIRRADLAIIREPAKMEGPAKRISAPTPGISSSAPDRSDSPRPEVYTNRDATIKSADKYRAHMGITPAAERLVRELLQQRRRAAGLRQTDLAARLGQPQVFVSKYERGDRRLDILEVRRICQELGLSLPEFVRQLEEALAAAGEPNTSDE